MNRALLSNALLLAACSLAVSPVNAAPQAKPAAKPADAAKPAASPKTAATLASIESTFTEEQTKAEKAIQEKKLTAIEGYITANATAPDRAKAMIAACDLSMELEKWAKGRGHAETFAKTFADHKDAMTMRLKVARCQSHEPGKETVARESFAAVIKDAAEPRIAVPAAIELADLFAEADDLEGAKKVLDDILDKPGLPADAKPYIKGKAEELDQLGKEPTPIEVKGLDGKPITLADFKGKVVLIDFWATWCAPCVHEMPNVIATYKKLHDKGFDILGISLDQKDAEQTLRDFIAERGMPWAQYYDGKGWKNDVAVAYGVRSIPATYLLDREGKVRGIGLRGDALGSRVEKLLNKGGAKATPAAGTKEPAKEPAKDPAKK